MGLGFLLLPVLFLLPGFSLLMGLRVEGYFRRFEFAFLCLLLSLALLPFFMIVLDLVGIGVSLFLAVLAVVGFGFAMYILRLTARSKIKFEKINVPLKSDLLALLISIGVCTVFGFSFISFPVFHPNLSIDPVIHSYMVLQILEYGHILNLGSYPSLLGAMPGLPLATRPLGFHALAFLVYAFSETEAIFAVRYFGAFLVCLIPLFCYFVALRLFRKWLIGVFACFVSAFIVPYGLVHFLGMGTYPNVLADLLFLAMLYFIGLFVDTGRWRLLIPISVIGCSLLLAHSMSPGYLFILWLFIPLGPFLSRRIAVLRRWVVSCAFAAIGIFLAIPFVSRFYNVALAWFSGLLVPTGTGGMFLVLPSEEPFTSIFGVSQFLGLYYLWLGPVGFILLVMAVIYILWKARGYWRGFIVFWFAFLFFLSLYPAFSRHFYRISALALIPSMLIISLFLGMFLIQFLEKTIRFKDYLKKYNLFYRRAILVLFLLIMIASGSFCPYMAHIIGSTTLNEKQWASYKAMAWLRTNSAPNASVISVESPLFEYTPAVAGRSFKGDFSFDSSGAYDMAKRTSSSFVVVNRLSEFAQGFELDSRFFKVYENQYVCIYIV